MKHEGWTAGMDEPREQKSDEKVPGSSLGTAMKVDDLCDRYETDWALGRRPTIAEFLADAVDPQERGAVRGLARARLGIEETAG